MATDTYSVGTGGRDYSTFSAAITAQAANTNDVVLEGYNDAAFDESITIGSTSPASWKIKPATGEGHDGTAGTGVRLVYSAATRNISFMSATQPTYIDQIEQDANGQAGLAGSSNTGGGTAGSRWSRMIHHGLAAFASSQDTIAIRPWSASMAVSNIVYDWENRNFSNSGIIMIQSGAAGKVYHNVVHSAGANSMRYGIYDQANAGTLKNNLSVNTTDSDFKFGVSSTHDHNASEDATANGTGAITGVAIADEVVSVVGGSEDYHLASGSQLIEAGTGLGTTPTGINIDIDGETRDASTPDIGADEYVAAGGVGATQLSTPAVAFSPASSCAGSTTTGVRGR